eukprot:13610594-Ditylum_brightwellii.AAC.1
MRVIYGLLEEEGQSGANCTILDSALGLDTKDNVKIEEEDEDGSSSLKLFFSSSKEQDASLWEIPAF